MYKAKIYGMKVNRFCKLVSVGLLCWCCLFIASALLSSCEDDNDRNSGTASFGIEGAPTGLAVEASGKTQSYIVRSNRPWKIVAQAEGSWVKVFPDEGDADGIFRIIVSENATFETRMMNFSIVVDGEEQPVLFRVDQAANVPYISVDASTSGVSIPAAGSTFSVAVKANVDWKYSVNGADWLTEAAVTGSAISLLAAPNMGDARTATLTISSDAYPELTQTVALTQSSAEAILEEDFNWLTYGNTVQYETTGETRYDLWTDEEKAHGWYSTPVVAADNQQLCYARPGFVKLGKTSYGGDLISPKLSGLQGTHDVTVTFKATAYISKGGAKDDNVLNVSVIGPGTVSAQQFIIDNFPNSSNNENGTDYNVWAPSIAQRQFVITGATSETQIKFLAGAYELTGVGQGKNRIFLDDIKVMLK
ncbi:BACON domain-containing protein [uncultured Bacteroides sp.]|uniref:BACON domain-containing protein n=1 Tax=uncultured Bacteroides sp. TaxID=162156 RepID=UPI002AA6034D|nr:BACON domain-containing protein [uncultured Bacteroides sp.]